jgi:hypothetical protein
VRGSVAERVVRLCPIDVLDRALELAASGAGGCGALSREQGPPSTTRAPETNNDGDKTVFDNFVTDFTQPQPLDMTVRYSTTRGEAPTTYSVQDLRLHVSLGYSF